MHYVEKLMNTHQSTQWRKNSMLREYQISNFKAFAGQEVIPIRPITLIYGQNSSGKSSVLQSLLLLKQTLEEAKNPMTLLLPRGSLVDLGGYSQFVNCHDLDKSFSFKVFFDIDADKFGNESKFISEYLTTNLSPSLGLHISFAYNEELSSIDFNRVDIFIGDKSKPLISYLPSLSEHSSGTILSASDEQDVNFEHSFWQFWWKEFKPLFSKAFFGAIKDTLDHKSIRLSPRATRKTITNKLQEQKASLKDEIEELEAEINELEINTEEIEIHKEAIDRRKARIYDLDDQFLRFDVLFELYERFEKYKFEQAKEDFLVALKYFSFMLCRQFIPNEIDNWEHDLSEPRNEYLSMVYETIGALQPVLDLTLKASSLLRKYLDDLVYIGPLRNYPERLYIFSGNTGEQVGQSGKMIAHILYKKPDVLNAVNRQLELFELGYEIKITSFKDEDTSDLSDVFAIRLIDKYTKVNVSLMDVGFGISQILPVIIQSVLSHNKTIIIEQPEIHIHPRLQAQLGSLLAESIKSPFGNQFIIETHSEHLLLRLQKLIRKGELTKEDISIIYVDRDSNGSKCLELRLDSEGDFIDEWPNGFFDEGFNEMFE